MKHKIASGTAMTFVTLALIGVLCAVSWRIFIPAFSNPTGSQTSLGEALTAIFSFIAALAAIWNTIAAHHYSISLEELKQQFSCQFPALQESRDAALAYYRTLAKMEIKNLTQEDIEISNSEMIQAEGSIYFLDENYRDAWYGYWQEANYISEIFRSLSVEEAQQQWRNSWAKQMASRLKTLAAYQA